MLCRFFRVTSLLVLALLSEQNLSVAAGKVDNERGSTPDLQPAACHLEDFSISGADIDQHYIHPTSLNIGRCVGTCSEASPATPYHQQLMKSSHYQGFCCVPTRFAPVTFLEHRDGRISITVMKRVIVTECGCY